MAKLPDAHRIIVWAEVMKRLSEHRIETPITKPQFRWLINYFDDNLETFENNTVAGLPDGDGKTWLLNNASIARRIVVMIMEKRREVL